MSLCYPKGTKTDFRNVSIEHLQKYIDIYGIAGLGMESSFLECVCGVASHFKNLNADEQSVISNFSKRMGKHFDLPTAKGGARPDDPSTIAEYMVEDGYSTRSRRTRTQHTREPSSDVYEDDRLLKKPSQKRRKNSRWTSRKQHVNPRTMNTRHTHVSAEEEDMQIEQTLKTEIHSIPPGPSHEEPIPQSPTKMPPTVIAPAGTAATATTITEGDASEVYCTCRGPSRGLMVGCDNDNCPHGGWFHYDCVGLKKEPEGSWFCPTCREPPVRERKRKNSSVTYNAMIQQSLARAPNHQATASKIQKFIEDNFSNQLNWTNESETRPTPVWKSSVKKMLTQEKEKYTCVDNKSEVFAFASGMTVPALEGNLSSAAFDDNQPVSQTSLPTSAPMSSNDAINTLSELADTVVSSLSQTQPAASAPTSVSDTTSSFKPNPSIQSTPATMQPLSTAPFSTSQNNHLSSNMIGSSSSTTSTTGLYGHSASTINPIQPFGHAGGLQQPSNLTNPVNPYSRHVQQSNQQQQQQQHHHQQQQQTQSQTTLESQHHF